MLRRKRIAMIALVAIIAGAGIVGVMLAGGCGEPQVIVVKSEDNENLPSPPVPTPDAPTTPTPDPDPTPIPVPEPTAPEDTGDDTVAESTVVYVRTDTDAYGERTELIVDGSGYISSIAWADSETGASFECAGWEQSETEDGYPFVYHEFTSGEMNQLGTEAAWGYWAFYAIGDGSGTELYERGDLFNENDEYVDGCWEAYWEIVQ